MKKHATLFPVMSWVLLLRFVRRSWTRTAKVASLIARKIFLPNRELRFPARRIDTSDRVERLRYLAWLAQRQFRRARLFGSLAEDLLAKGRTQTARKVAWGAFLHWQYSRNADQSFRAERSSARHHVVV